MNAEYVGNWPFLGLQIVASLAFLTIFFKKDGLIPIGAFIIFFLAMFLFWPCRDKVSEGTLATESILPVETSWEVLSRDSIEDQRYEFVRNLKTGKELGIKTKKELPEKFTVKWENPGWIGRTRKFVPF